MTLALQSGRERLLNSALREGGWEIEWVKQGGRNKDPSHSISPASFASSVWSEHLFGTHSSVCVRVCMVCVCGDLGNAVKRLGLLPWLLRIQRPGNTFFCFFFLTLTFLLFFLLFCNFIWQHFVLIKIILSIVVLSLSFTVLLSHFLSISLILWAQFSCKLSCLVKKCVY